MLLSSSDCKGVTDGTDADDSFDFFNKLKKYAPFKVGCSAKGYSNTMEPTTITILYASDQDKTDIQEVSVPKLPYHF